MPAAKVTGVETISIQNINGTPAVTGVTAVNEQQTVAVSGAATATSTMYLGVATTVVAADANTAVATKIAANKVNILAGETAKALGLIDITADGAGVLTLTYSSTKGNVANQSASVSNGSTFAASVETVIGVVGVAAVAAQTFVDEVSAANFTGAKLFVNDLSKNQVDFTGLTATQGVQINGNGVTTNGATNVQYAASSTVANLTVNGGVNTGAVGLTSAGGSGIATVSLASTGAATGTTAALGANVLSSLVLGGSATALNITANNNTTTGNITGFTGTAAAITVNGTAGALNLGTLENTTVKTVNASAFAGGLTTTLNTNAAIAFTGGAGNDVVTTGAVLTTGSVNGGAGTGDILVAGNVAHVNTAALGAKYTNFETLRVGGTMDASLIAGITKVQLTANGNILTNVSAAQTVQAFTATTIGATTIAPVSGTTNTLNLSLGQGTTITAAASTGVLTLTGYETVNLSTNAGPTAAVGADRTSTVTGAISSANLTAVNLSGTAFTFTDIATTKATTWNGSALIGNGNSAANAITGLTVAGNITSGSSVIGSGVADSLTLGTAVASTYNGGGGNDVFIGTVAQFGTGNASSPTIIGGDGTDTIRITDAAANITATDAMFKSISGVEALNISTTSGTISVTGLTTNANAAFATGMTVTNAALANAKAFTFESLAYDKAVTLTLTGALTVGTSTAGTISVTTGVGNDKVTVSAANFVGAAGAGGQIAVATGDGIDTISITTGTLLANTNQAITVNAGKGADIISVTHVNGASDLGNAKFIIAAGDSTTSAYDSITGFRGVGGAISDALDFASVGITAYAATAAAGFTAAQLTVAVSAAGLVTFAGTSAATLTLDQKIAAVQSVVTTNAGDSAVFTNTAAGVTNTYVFNNNATADSVVELVNISAVALLTTNNATTDNAVFIM